MYLEDGQDIPLDSLRASAEEFEGRIFPSIIRYAGISWPPGIDNDPHLTVLNARIPAVAGYFSTADQYPTLINPFSNQRKIIYINLDAVRPGSTSYNKVLAHEFQHAVYWHLNPNTESWINEGAAELAAELAGYPSSFPASFLRHPDIQLTTWPEATSASAPHYGASLLFLKYLAQHYGGYGVLGQIPKTPGRGQAAISRYLQNSGYKTDFTAVFKDWVIANYLDQPGSGRYSYPDDEVQVQPEQVINAPGSYRGTVRQYAADYLELALASGDFQVHFRGNPSVRLLPNQAHSGQTQWWANRGDSIDTTLTREFDLSNLERATLEFWTWFDLEKPWDYAYVQVSRDGGRTWTVLPGQHTTSDNPLGNSFGPAYTGKSGGGQGPIWVQEHIDLSPFTGGRILLRFEYVTDEAVNNPGFALDDISIPELGFRDDAESGAGWEARGFFRTCNSLRQRFTVQVIKVGEKTTVEEVPVDPQGRGRLELRGFGAELRKAVLVIAAHTPFTTQEANYTVTISSLEPSR
jgi:hypothetical protein